MIRVSNIVLLFFYLNSCSGLSNNTPDIFLGEFKMKQRTSKKISLNDNLILYIDDITGGNVCVDILYNDNTIINDCIGESEDINFSYEKTDYQVEINQLDNHLFGEDYAYITVQKIF